MKVLIADQLEPTVLDAVERLGCEVRSDPSLSAETMGEALEAFGPEVLVVRSTKVPAAVLDGARTLKLVVRAGAGYDTIDTGAAGARGIAVCNCPGMNAVAVAELAMAHLLSCDRRVPAQTADLRAGRWNKQEYAKARGLKGLRLCVVGVGAIGRAVVQRALAFEMDVVAWSRSMTPDRARDLGVISAGSTREELVATLPTCEAVSVHVAATPETEGMCDAEFFGALPEGAYFVNTSRGSVVDEDALADAVSRRGLRAGLDVYRGQPSEKRGEWRTPLAELEGVASMTHHVGASTEQAQRAVGEEAVHVIEVYMTTGRLEHCVNEDELTAAGVEVITRPGLGSTAGG